MSDTKQGKQKNIAPHHREKTVSLNSGTAREHIRALACVTRGTSKTEDTQRSG